MYLRISHSGKPIRGKIRLPSSKSVSNRLLIMNALSDEPAELQHLSESEDTRVLQEALQQPGGTLDIGHAGTAMRFLTAYLSLGRGRYILTGSGRMQERPIAALVDALRRLGADIRYLGKEGFPPLEIHGRSLKGGQVHIDSSISSQYISALMMIAPVLEDGLTIVLDREPVSASYLRMTRALMEDWGVDSDFDKNILRIPPAKYTPRDTKVEGDWSAAGYWYAMTGLASRAEMILEGLQVQSTQGDAALVSIFQTLGVETLEVPQGLQLRKIPVTTTGFSYHFGDSPDLVQTLCVYCGLKNIPFEMEGTQTLRIKETDRIAALQHELGHFGIEVLANDSGSRIWWDGSSHGTAKPAAIPRIRTYKDHRMAMAFAGAALVRSPVLIEDAGVVQKSYPGFWKDMQAVGFETAEIPG